MSRHMTAGEERQRELSKQFGENVRRNRERKGMSQAELATEMAERGWPWHQSTVFKIEHAERRTDAYEVHDLAAILGVPMDRLFWAGAEASETAFVEEIAAILHREWNETANAVARLHAAMSRGRNTAASSGESKYERAREAAGRLAGELEVSTLDTAMAEGARRYEHPEAP
jgi:transcriptional regulator with XRE-family HTH domain